MTNYYYLDLTGTNGFSTNIVTGSLTNLSFAVGGATAIWGTNGPVASNYVVFTGQPFTTNWPPGTALWLVWEMTNNTGSSQGLGIDNLTFSAAGPGTPVPLTIAASNTVVVFSWPSVAGTNLQVTSDLSQPSGWVAANLLIVASNQVNTVTVPIGAGTQFYRLKQQ